MNKFTSILTSLVLTASACGGAQVDQNNKCTDSSKKLTSALIDIENATRTARIEKITSGQISETTRDAIQAMHTQLFDKQVIMEAECENQTPPRKTPSIKSFEYRAETLRQELIALKILQETNPND